MIKYILSKNEGRIPERRKICASPGVTKNIKKKMLDTTANFKTENDKSKLEAVRRHQNMHYVIKCRLILKAKENHWRVLNSGKA